MKIDSSHPLAARAVPAGRQAPLLRNGNTDEARQDACRATIRTEFTTVEVKSPRFSVSSFYGGIRFVLPLPPSNNELVMPVGGRLVKTKTARAWVDAVKPVVEKARGLAIRGPVAWWMTAHVSHITRDAPNCVKQLEDVLKGFAWADDLQVVEFHGKKVICRSDEERVVFVVKPVECDAETARRVYKSKAVRDMPAE